MHNVQNKLPHPVIYYNQSYIKGVTMRGISGNPNEKKFIDSY